jgi:hypothetical protein
MTRWDDVIARYLAAEEANEGIFARLNTVRCEQAIRDGQDSYIAIGDDGDKQAVRIDWEHFQGLGFRRPPQTPAATVPRILHVRRWSVLSAISPGSISGPRQADTGRGAPE